MGASLFDLAPSDFQYLFSARHAIVCDCWLNTRVIGDLPCVSSTLEALLAQATQLDVKTQRRLDYLEDNQPSQAPKAVDKYAPADSLALLPTVNRLFYLLERTKDIFHRPPYQVAALQPSIQVMQMVLASRQCVVLSEDKNNVTVQLKSTLIELIQVTNLWDEPCELSAEPSDSSCMTTDSLRIGFTAISGRSQALQHPACCGNDKFSRAWS